MYINALSIILSGCRQIHMKLYSIILLKFVFSHRTLKEIYMKSIKMVFMVICTCWLFSEYLTISYTFTIKYRIIYYKKYYLNIIQSNILLLNVDKGKNLNVQQKFIYIYCCYLFIFSSIGTIIYWLVISVINLKKRDIYVLMKSVI